MIGMFDKFLPFGQYFYLYVRDNLDDFKKIIKNFLVVRLEKNIDSEKILSINVLDLLDLYVPPFNVLLVVKVVGQDGEERFSLEASNYPQEVLALNENGVSIFVSGNERLIVEFYALDDSLFEESVKRFKNLLKEKGLVNAANDITNEVINLVSNSGYKLTSRINIERAEIIKRLLQLIENIIIEGEVS
jgi:hypothetical protein